jgi:hypothetical protein
METLQHGIIQQFYVQYAYRSKQQQHYETGYISKLWSWDFFVFFLFMFSIHLSPLRFHPVEGCWDRNQDLIHTRLDLIHTRLDLNHCLARSHSHSVRSRLVFK